MAVKSFTPDNNAALTPPEQPRALVPAEPDRTLSANVNYVSDDEVQGELDATDRRTPRINVVAKVGELSERFNPGSIVLNKETVLAEKDQPITVYPVKIRKRYQEDTEFGEDMGKTANSLEEVLAAGGQIRDKNAAGFYIPIADIVFLVKRPANATEEQEVLFNIEIDGAFYLAAIYTARKSSYNSCARPIFDAKQNGRSVRETAYTMTSALKKWNGNAWFCPGLRPAGKTPVAVLEFLKASNF